MRKEKELYDLLFMFTSQIFSADEKSYILLVEDLRKGNLIKTFNKEFQVLSDYDDIHKSLEFNKIFKELKNFNSSNKNDDYTFLIRLIVHMFAIKEKIEEEK